MLEGTYNCSGPILLNRDNITIRGMDAGTIIKRFYNNTSSDTAFGLITVTSNYTKVQDLAVDGNKSSYAATYNKNIKTEGCITTIQDCYLYNGDTGVYMDAHNLVAGYSAKIINNWCYNCVTGIYAGNSKYCLFQGNYCRNNTYGIYLTNSSSNCSVTGNLCFDNTTYNIRIGGSSSYNTITGNVCGLTSGSYTNSQYSINLENTVTYNTVLVNSLQGKDVTNSGGSTNKVMYNVS